MLAELYHAHHSRHAEDIPFWLELATQTGSPVLELGCGTGRVLLPLATAGYRTVGVDNDLSMLVFLKSMIGEDAHPSPQLILADMSRFKLAANFPLILLPCNTFSTLGEEKRRFCLECVHHHLQPGGLFAVSVPNPEQLMDLPTRSGVEIEDEFIDPFTGNPVQVSSSWRRTTQIFKVIWSYDQLLPNGIVERQEVEVAQQIVPVDTYLAEIQNAGMKVLEIYGDFDRSKYIHDSPSLILLATS